jgi:hypothetical protein
VPPDRRSLGYTTIREVVPMKLRLLLIAMVACACSAPTAIACEAHKAAGKTAQAKSAHTTVAASHAKHANHEACTAEMAARCTPAMKAACESNAAVAKAMGCETSKGVTTMNVVAAGPGTRARTAGKGGDCCAMKGARGARTTAAVAAVATHGNGIEAEFSAAQTRGNSYASHAQAMAGECASCASWVSCETDVRSLGAKQQVVPLKNGVMVVYTADSPGDVRVLQSMVAKRHDRMVAALASSSLQKLCDECKQLRGAMASGKLNREVVNVERGCMTLMTSNDRGVVQKIRAMNGQPVATR